MAPRPFQLHARKEIVTVETIARPVTSFSERETAEVEAELWRKAGFIAEVVDVSAGESPSLAMVTPTELGEPEADTPEADPDAALAPTLGGIE